VAAVVGLQIVLHYGEHDKSKEWAIWEAGHATATNSQKDLCIVILCSKYAMALIFFLSTNGCAAQWPPILTFFSFFFLSANGCAAQWPPASQG
jgi:hypothetical protein